MMTHDQEIEKHPFFKKHFEGKSVKQFHEMPDLNGSKGYHQWTVSTGVSHPVQHKIFHRFYPETGNHGVAITTGKEGKNILGGHTYHSGEGEGSSATEAFEKALHAYKNDHGFHLQENINQFNLKEGVKTTKNLLEQI